MRGLIRALLALGAALAGACAAQVGAEPPVEPTDPVEAARAYVEDARVRRAALEASVSVADTAYGRERLAHYALSGAGLYEPWSDWDLLPELIRGPVRRLRVAEAEGAPSPEPFPAEAILEGDVRLFSLQDYVTAGQRAFELCPIQIDARFSRLRRGADVARSYGLSVGPDGEVRGAVELQGRDGRWVVALTCVACHSSTARDGSVVAGLPDPALRLAELLGAPIFPAGTMDVTPDGLYNPVRPPDLRPVRHQARLHHTGNLGNGRVARMVRIETLITSHSSFESRPYRPIVASMALYLESLADTLPAPDWASEGGQAFRASCAGCHATEAMAGPPVAAEVVGTDPAATAGSSRGTGGYRAPSLLGAAEREGLLHDGSARSLRALLGLEDSAHRGHAFGLDLPVATREALVGFLGAAPSHE